MFHQMSVCGSAKLETNQSDLLVHRILTSNKNYELLNFQSILLKRNFIK